MAYSYGTAEGPLGYAYTYPSQNGLILYMAVLAFFFGDAAYVVFQILNIGFFILGIVSLQRMTVRGNERCSLLLWMACCLPFSFYILFVYGTMPGFGLSCLAMERLVRYVEEGRGRDFWIGAAAVAAAVILKSNYEIVLVALFLYLASSGVFRRKARLLVAAVLLITHDLELAIEMADRILVFYDGTILEEVKPENFREGRNLKEPYTQALYRALPEHEFFGGE